VPKTLKNFSSLLMSIGQDRDKQDTYDANMLTELGSVGVFQPTLVGYLYRTGLPCYTTIHEENNDTTDFNKCAGLCQ
jgi:hypothetical protein